MFMLLLASLNSAHATCVGEAWGTADRVFEFSDKGVNFKLILSLKDEDSISASH